MIATVAYIKERFFQFNNSIFAGRLPEPVITLCDATTFVGQFKSKIRQKSDGSIEHYDFNLRFSTAFNLKENELDDTIIHEMIHLFIACHGLGDRTAHGQLFKALMKSINETHNRDITISHRTNSIDRATVTNTKKKWHIVAVLEIRGGNKGIKVLPRVVQKVVEFYKKAINSTNVTTVSLYLTDNPFFNRYPTSTALKYYPVDENRLTESLTGAHTLKVIGNTLRQT